VVTRGPEAICVLSSERTAKVVQDWLQEFFRRAMINETDQQLVLASIGSIFQHATALQPFLWQVEILVGADTYGSMIQIELRPSDPKVALETVGPQLPATLAWPSAERSTEAQAVRFVLRHVGAGT
jgi:hypothetical protein